MCSKCESLQEQVRLLQDRYEDAIDVIDAHREQIKTRDKAIKHLLAAIRSGDPISAARLAEWSDG